MEALVTPGSGFWKGKRVLITGATGFKGSWLSFWLAELGAVARGISLAPPSDQNLWNEARLAEVVDDVRCDIRDLAALQAEFDSFKPAVVLHLAAQSLVLPSYADPVGTFAINVLGTVHVLEAVRQCPSVRVVVNVTSDKCYENREWHWAYREIDPMGGHDPYSCSKGCSELATAAYRASFFQGTEADDAVLASVRAGNVIGGGDWAGRRIIPDAMRAFARGEDFHVRSPGAVRPWQHVLEPLSGYLVLCERLYNDGQAFAEGWNFGPVDTDAKEVAYIADKLVAYWGAGVSWSCPSEPEKHEAGFLKIDASKARNLLGWKPRLTLDTALEWTVDWYRRFYAGEPARELIREQVARYAGWSE